MLNGIRLSRLLLVAAGLTVAVARTSAQVEKTDAAVLARIREEGMNHSRVMHIMTWLSDVYGPRLTGSPAFEDAGAWAMKTLREYGLSNVHEERFAFGQGWSLVSFHATMTLPQVQPIIALPKAWTPGTHGVVSGMVVRPVIATETDFARYHGKLRGTIVLTQPARVVRMLDGRIVLRLDARDSTEVVTPAPGPARRARPAASAFQRHLQEFYKREGVLALLDRGTDADTLDGSAGAYLGWYTQKVDGGTFIVAGSGARDSTAENAIPELTLAVEHYNRMVRILEAGVPVKMELEIGVKFYPETKPRGFNIIAEIPGTDLKLRDQFVLTGAHFDTWHGATGATDNTSGSAAMMEAMRILKSVGTAPRRTIRLALWGGEEEGELGSHEYVREHVGDPSTMTLKPESEKFAGYYNIDNGTGRIRGIWMEGNPAVEPIFRSFFQPLKDLGVTILSPRSIVGSDYEAFDEFGLPAFPLMQERYESISRTHHTNMDVVDRVQPDDMRQMATVAATIVYLTAQRDEKLPRKPLPPPMRSERTPPDPW